MAKDSGKDICVPTKTTVLGVEYEQEFVLKGGKKILMGSKVWKNGKYRYFY